MKIEKQNKIRKTEQRYSSGFVALFTVLIASMIMLMIIGMTSISYKETLLTRSSTDSEFAFFASDTGVECALYYDRKVGAFPETLGIEPASSINCRNITASIEETGDLNYRFLLDSGADWCADVRVDKNFFESGTYYTKIESFGYNTNCESRGTSPSVVERALRVKYPNAFFAI